MVKVCPSQASLEYQFGTQEDHRHTSLFHHIRIISYFALRTSTKIFLDLNSTTESKYSKNRGS